MQSILNSTGGKLMVKRTAVAAMALMALGGAPATPVTAQVTLAGSGTGFASYDAGFECDFVVKARKFGEAQNKSQMVGYRTCNTDMFSWQDGNASWGAASATYDFNLNVNGGVATFTGTRDNIIASVGGTYNAPLNAFYVYLDGRGTTGGLTLNAYGETLVAAGGEQRWWYFTSANDLSGALYMGQLVTAGVTGANEIPRFEVHAGRVVADVPEPLSLLLLGTGLVGVAGVTNRRRKML
jgi:hypothetical protein